MARTYKACLQKVDGSTPPVRFLDELVDWGRICAGYAFHVDCKRRHLCKCFAGSRALYGRAHRKAVMLEVLRVLAGIESGWRWEIRASTPTRQKIPTPEK